MSLDLERTALQIDEMAAHLRSQQSDRTRRLRRAVETAHGFDVEAYRQERERGADSLRWGLPGVLDSPAARRAAPDPPGDYRVAAADGSHIDIDRHLPARCYLINVGVSVLTYGSGYDARLFNEPRLYARDEELSIREDGETSREQAVGGVVLGAKRAVEEVRRLAEVVSSLDDDRPTVALLDGSLVLMGLVGHGYHDFVLRELVENGYVRALDELRRAAERRRLALASYVSLPNGFEVVNALRTLACAYGPDRSGWHCGRGYGVREPCDACVGGLLDREVYREMLEPGERSGLFASSSHLVEQYYAENAVHFFYVHAGEEIGRVEVPAWVAGDTSKLDLVHSVVVDQCKKGPGYPIALMEAHEQAVVTGADRRLFVEIVRDALVDRRVPAHSSEKDRSKRIRPV